MHVCVINYSESSFILLTLSVTCVFYPGEVVGRERERVRESKNGEEEEDKEDGEEGRREWMREWWR